MWLDLYTDGIKVNIFLPKRWPSEALPFIQVCGAAHCDVISAFPETAASGWRQIQWDDFKAIHRESCFLNKNFSTAAVKNSLNHWIVIKETILQAKIYLIFQRFQCSVTSRKRKRVTHEQTALYSIALHYLVFIIVSPVGKLLLYVALFSITDLYMCYGYITIYILPSQRNNTIKCPIDLLCALCHT